MLNIEALHYLVSSFAEIWLQLHVTRNSIYEKLKRAEVKTQINIPNKIIQLRNWNYDKE